MLHIYLAAVGGLALVLGLASGKVRHLPVTEPLAGLVLGVVIGPEVLALIPRSPTAVVLPGVTEVSLAVSVMAVALRHRMADIRAQVVPLAILLTVVLAVMAAITGALAAATLGVSLSTAVLLGAALAPTDPVLAASIVTGNPAEQTLPQRLRLLISIESGANDGLGFIFVSVAIAFAAAAHSVGEETLQSVVQLLWSIALGTALGVAAGRALLWATRQRDIEHSAFLALTIVLALFVLGASELARAQGVLTVFVAGLAYDAQIAESERREEWEIQEAVNRFVILPVFAFFGVVLPWDAWANLGWRGVAFAVAVLVLRRPPVVLLLRRPLRLNPPDATFAGWYGPIGVAALFYLTEIRHSAAGDPEVWAAGTLVIAASTVAHGLTAAPGRAWYARVTSR